MDNLPARQKQLKVAISASTNGDYICSGNAILQHSLARIVDVQVIGMSITYYGKVLVSYYVSWLFLYKSYNEIVVTKIIMMSYIILYEAPFDIAWLLSGVMYSCCYVIQLIHSKDLKRMAPQNIGPLMNDTADNYQFSYTYNDLSTCNPQWEATHAGCLL